MSPSRRLPASWLLLGAVLVSSPSAGVPRFDLVVDALDPQACGTGCWTNYLRVTDVDGDDDLDVVLASYPDFFDGNNVTQPLVIYLNDGSGAFTNVSAAAVGGFSGSLRQIAMGDVDGDGDLDLWIDNIGGSFREQLLINDGAGHFTDETAARVSGNPTGADDGGVKCVDVDVAARAAGGSVGRYRAGTIRNRRRPSMR